MKKILALIMVALLIFSMAACAKKNADDDDNSKDDNPLANKNEVTTDIGTFEYGVNEEGEYEITKYDPKSVAVIDLKLPTATPDGREIVGIATGAFKEEGSSSIKSVTVPETYKYIGKQAFYDCKELKTVTMANSVTHIYEGAFQSCEKLESVTFSKSLAVISDYAFAECAALTAVDVSGETAVIGEAAFFGCSALTSVKLSDKLTSVNKTSFMECPNLVFTTFDNGKYLGNEKNPHLAFISVTDLNVESCVVNDNTKIIATNALANCSDLREVTLGAAVAYVNGDCFTNSPWIEYVEYENARYLNLGKGENPAMVMISVILISADHLTVHENTAIIADSALEKCEDISDISYAKTAADWNKIAKSDVWNNDMTITIHCSDKKITQ